MLAACPYLNYWTDSGDRTERLL